MDKSVEAATDAALREYYHYDTQQWRLETNRVTLLNPNDIWDGAPPRLKPMWQAICHHAIAAFLIAEAERIEKCGSFTQSSTYCRARAVELRAAPAALDGRK